MPLSPWVDWMRVSIRRAAPPCSKHWWVWGHAPPGNVSVSEASEEHFLCFLKGIFIKVVNFLHLTIQDFVMRNVLLHFITFYNFIQPVKT